MRWLIGGIGLVFMGSVLTACGQSGNLQLASSPDYDKRAKYLLYSKDDKTDQAQKKVQDQITVPDQSVPASQVTSN